VTVEARRDRKSRNADWYEEARGQGQSLRRCSRANCSAVNVEGNFANDRRIIEDVAVAPSIVCPACRCVFTYFPHWLPLKPHLLSRSLNGGGNVVGGGTSRDSSAHCIGCEKRKIHRYPQAPKLISLHAYDADKMIMKLANQAVCNWPSRNSGDGRSAAIVLSKYEMACLNDLTVKSTQLKFAACNECAAFVDRGGNLWLSETDLERLETTHSSAARLGFYQAELGLSLFRFSASLNR
jgi:hypothetical protein